VGALRSWMKDGAHRIDRDGDGQYEDQAAVAFMDAWWPNLIHRLFDPELDGLYDKAQAGLDQPANPGGSSYFDGYYGYVQKAVRMALGRHPVDPYRVLRCGDGTLAGCRKAILASMRATVKGLGDDTSSWKVDEGAEAIDYAAIGLVDVPNMPWQNRPT